MQKWPVKITSGTEGYTSVTLAKTMEEGENYEKQAKRKGQRSF